jgi:hypothetical protein
MKRLLPVLLLAVFLLALFVGYRVAPALFSSSPNQGAGTTPGPGQATQASLRQENVLFVQVDSLQNRQPALLATWLGFFSFGDDAQLLFLPLFPSGNASRDQELTRRFALGSDGMLGTAFAQYLRSTFHVSWSPTLLVDSQGLSTIHSALLGSDPGNAYQASSQETSWTERLSPTYHLIQLACDQFIRDPAAMAGQIPWLELEPDHLRTSLELDELVDTAKTLKTAQSASCKPIVGDQ